MRIQRRAGLWVRRTVARDAIEPMDGAGRPKRNGRPTCSPKRRPARVPTPAPRRRHPTTRISALAHVSRRAGPARRHPLAAASEALPPHMRPGALLAFSTGRPASRACLFGPRAAAAGARTAPEAALAGPADSKSRIESPKRRKNEPPRHSRRSPTGRGAALTGVVLRKDDRNYWCGGAAVYDADGLLMPGGWRALVVDM